MIGGRFALNSKINAGSFGEIHLATDSKTRQRVAVKLEPLKAKHPQLEYEAKLLAYLTEQVDPRAYGLPRIHFYGKYDKYHALVMELLGPSLEDLFQRCSKKFTLKTVVMIGLQIIDRLKYMHRKKFIHRDIKPENFLLGVNEYCGAVFMIDLGLSKKFIQKNGQHIPYRDDRSLKGTPRYTSLNSHLGIEQSRRDDLESVLYMLIYFLRGQLPWQNLKPDQDYDRYEKILERKLSVSTQNLTAGLPAEFKELLDYVKGLHFIEEPDYDLIKKRLQQALLNEGITLKSNDLYCWETEEPNQQTDSNPTQNTKQKQNSRHSLGGSVSNEVQGKSAAQKDSGSDHHYSSSNPFDTAKQGSQHSDPFDEFNFKNSSSVPKESERNPFNENQEHSQNNPFGDSFDEFGGGEKIQKDDPFANYEYKDPEIQQL